MYLSIIRDHTSQYLKMQYFFIVVINSVLWMTKADLNYTDERNNSTDLKDSTTIFPNGLDLSNFYPTIDENKDKDLNKELKEGYDLVENFINAKGENITKAKNLLLSKLEKVIDETYEIAKQTALAKIRYYEANNMNITLEEILESVKLPLAGWQQSAKEKN